MYLKVTDVEYNGDYSLICTFNDGAVKKVDMTPVLDAPAFQELKDLNQFKQFGLDETIFWGNGADIAPEWLYQNGVPIAQWVEKIQEIWFDNGRIFMRSVSGNVFSRPLEAFPVLKDATDLERQQFYIWGNGEYVRWKALDEDLSVDSFMETQEPNFDNEVSNIFRRCSWLNIAEVAKFIGMPKAVLDRFIYGIWQPKAETLASIKHGIRSMSTELSLAVS